VERIARGVALISCLMQAGIWGSRALRGLVERHFAGAVDQAEDLTRQTVAKMLGLAARVILWTVLVLVALDNFGVNITALVAGLGVGGVAVALATQNILGDLFASVSILLDKPFVPGDFITRQAAPRASGQLSLYRGRVPLATVSPTRPSRV
jgi:small-conductance mechanosensitive channel